MKRVRRWLFNSLAAISLLMFLGGAIHVAIHFQLSDWSRLQFYWHTTYAAPKSFTPVTNHGYLFFIFEFARVVWLDHDGLHRELCLWIPTWFFLLLTGPLPATWCVVAIRKREKERQRPFGLCCQCGYDLRATPDRCPECGTVPPKKETIAR